MAFSAIGGVEALPPDLFHLVAAQLEASARGAADGEAARFDFAALYNGILSSKYLAQAGFITALYRICLILPSPVRSGGSENISFAERDIMVMKWSILWRTIILSALGKTLHPYCRHLRELDLRDLDSLLETLDEPKFKTKVAKQFFAGDLKRFHHVNTSSQKWRAGRLEVKKILIDVADLITQQAPLIEGIAEPSSSDIMTSRLSVWVPRLSHLRELELWDGKALADETLRNLLHAHCPNLDNLRIHHSSAPESDHVLALFISGMPLDKLRHFENISQAGIGQETCLALNNHGKSLRSLKLALEEEGILALGLLQSCTSLRCLAVTALRQSVDLKATQNDVFLEIVEWLKACNNLKDVSLHALISAPDLLLPILENPLVQLRELHITATESSMYTARDHAIFHKALGNHTSLEKLKLSADPDPISRDLVETVVDSLGSLQGLRELSLLRISDYFSDQDISKLAQRLPLLETLYIGGYGISDVVLGYIADLKFLKNLTIAGISRFTVEGLLDFVEQLGQGNEGLVTSVDMAEPEFMISDDGQDLIRQSMAIKINGRFEYQPLRGERLDTIY
jgi:hypothetical protein